jgi:hypothetical protein
MSNTTKSDVVNPAKQSKEREVRKLYREHVDGKHELNEQEQLFYFLQKDTESLLLKECPN